MSTALRDAARAATILVLAALAQAATAEPFRSGPGPDGPGARSAPRERWARPDYRRRSAPPVDQGANGPGQAPYVYGAPSNGGYGYGVYNGDFSNPPPRPAPPPSPRGLHNGLWYY